MRACNRHATPASEEHPHIRTWACPYFEALRWAWSRPLVLDAGQASMRVARSVVAELAREIRLGPPSGLWHVIPAAVENLHVRRRCFKDVEFADTALAAAWSPALCGTGQSKLGGS